MSDTNTVRTLLEVENTLADQLFERVSGSDAYLWPIARWPIARALSQAEVKLELRAGKPTTRAQILKRVARLALYNPASSDRLSAQADHLFIVSGTTHSADPRGIGNWLTDAFAEPLGHNAVVVQDAAFDVLTRRSMRPANPRTWTYAQALARSWRATQAAPFSEQQRKHTVSSLQQIFDLFGEQLPEPLRQRLLSEILPLAEEIPAADAEFASLLERVRPKKIYLQMAAYGNRSNLIRLAHDRGISVIEPQHGWIGAAHAAYNFGAAWQNTVLTDSLPDTLLTFGSYWGNNLRFPGRIVPAGKAPLELAALEAPSFETRPLRALVISSEYETQKLLTSAVLLKQALPESWEVALRPHPAERSVATEIFAQALSAGVVLDTTTDLNASLSSSRAVVGMTSTVLFEALPLGVHVGVIETDLARHYAEATVFPDRLDNDASFKEFASLVQGSPRTRKVRIEDIWLPESVSAFLSEAARE